MSENTNNGVAKFQAALVQMLGVDSEGAKLIGAFAEKELRRLIRAEIERWQSEQPQPTDVEPADPFDISRELVVVCDNPPRFVHYPAGSNLGIVYWRSGRTSSAGPHRKDVHDYIKDGGWFAKSVPAAHIAIGLDKPEAKAEAKPESWDEWHDESRQLIAVHADGFGFYVFPSGGGSAAWYDEANPEGAPVNPAYRRDHVWRERKFYRPVATIAEARAMCKMPPEPEPEPQPEAKPTPDNPPLGQCTLRDMFAAQALTGILAGAPEHCSDGQPNISYAMAAGEALKYADAMLAARKGGAAC